MNDAQLIQLFNLLYPDNNERQISEEDLRNGLTQFLNALSGRIGNLQNLQTSVKTSIVNAINSIKVEVDEIWLKVDPLFGNADPNEVPPPNFDIGSIYIQQENIGGNIYNVGYWIYTGVRDVDWLNITSLVKKVYQGPDNPNTVTPDGFTDDQIGAFYYQRVYATQGTVDRGFWVYVSPVTGWINLMAKEVLMVNTLPTTGISGLLYIRTSDNTLHRFQGESFPPSWRQLGGSPASNYFQVEFTGDNNIEAPAGTNDVPYIIIDSTIFQKGTGAFEFVSPLVKLTPGYALMGQKIMIFRT